MAIRIHDVLDYLDHHPLCAECDDVKTLLGRIREIYVSHNNTAGEQVCAICAEREQAAFEQGIVVGMQLMTEVNWVR